MSIFTGRFKDRIVSSDFDSFSGEVLTSVGVEDIYGRYRVRRTKKQRCRDEIRLSEWMERETMIEERDRLERAMRAKEEREYKKRREEYWQEILAMKDKEQLEKILTEQAYNVVGAPSWYSFPVFQLADMLENL